MGRQHASLFCSAFTVPPRAGAGGDSVSHSRSVEALVWVCRSRKRLPGSRNITGVGIGLVLNTDEMASTRPKPGPPAPAVPSGGNGVSVCVTDRAGGPLMGFEDLRKHGGMIPRAGSGIRTSVCRSGTQAT